MKALAGIGKSASCSTHFVPYTRFDNDSIIDRRIYSSSEAVLFNGYMLSPPFDGVAVPVAQRCRQRRQSRSVHSPQAWN